MNTNNSFQDQLRELLHSLFDSAKDASGNKEVQINCPLCNKEGNPDSGKHMYISLGYDDKPPMYNCFKNINHRGILTKSFLEENSDNPQVLDIELLNKIESHTKNVSNLSRYRLNKQGKLNINSINLENNKLSSIKLNYINTRLGLNLDYNELSKNKIILNILDLLKYNNITKYTRDYRVLELLNTYFLGFLVNNNSCIILRNLTDKNKIKLPEYLDNRYIKYNITNQSIHNSYYIIPTICDIYKHIKIHISEGTFDIISIFYNLRNRDRNNNIYASIGGNTYEKLIEYFICDLGLIDIEFHIYIDNDISNYIIPNIKSKLVPLDIDCYIHMNMKEGEKDFGVNKNRIKEYIYKL